MKKTTRRQRGRLPSLKSKTLSPAGRARQNPAPGATAVHKTAKREEPAKGAEYRLLIAPQFNEREQRFKTLFVLETMQLFSSFKYDLSVSEQINGKLLQYSILGLKTPLISLSGSGRAQYTREYGELRGTYEVKVTGLDGSISSFTVRIAPERVTLVRKPSKGFIEVIVDKAHWSVT